MAKYKETTLTGESWVRAFQLVGTNLFNGTPSIQYSEEEIINLSNGETIKLPYIRPNGKLVIEHFNQDNSSELFPLINPDTGVELGTTATYQDIYIMLHSLYFHIAEKVDRGPAPYPSWIWNNETQEWEAPVAYPDDGLTYSWNETSQSWIESTP